MKRNQGIWAIIIVIILIGIGSTSVMNRFVTKQGENVLDGSAGLGLSQSARSEMAELSPDKTLKSNETVAEAGLPADTYSIEETTLAIPPIAAAGAVAETLAEGTSKHLQHLEELDAQIAVNRAANKEATTSTMKVNAEYELRLWETEMETIVEVLSRQLSAENYEDFLTQQRSWLRERETQAMEASKKRSGSALESVEYTASLAEQTRSRVYAIAEEYKRLLEEQ